MPGQRKLKWIRKISEKITTVLSSYVVHELEHESAYQENRVRVPAYKWWQIFQYLQYHNWRVEIAKWILWKNKWDHLIFGSWARILKCFSPSISRGHYYERDRMGDTRSKKVKAVGFDIWVNHIYSMPSHPRSFLVFLNECRRSKNAHFLCPCK